MGQYYKIVNLDKKQYIVPHACNDGAKLMEFGLSSLGTMSCLAILLANGNGRGGGDLHSQDPIIGSWAGDRIVITGDYADKGGKGCFVPKGAGPIEYDGKEYEEYTLYTLADTEFGWEDVSIPTMRALAEDSYVRQQFEERAAKSDWMKEKYAPVLK